MTIFARKFLGLSLLALLLSATALFGTEELTAFQKRIPGPKKLAMTEADYSGTVHTDPQYIADRQAIVNLVNAYSYLFDEQRFDEWFDLFTDDVSFETTTPCFGTIIAKGKAAFKGVVDMRYRGPGSDKVKTMRRHTMGNVHVAKQTKNSAEVRTYLFISAASPDGALKMLTSGTYNATLVKRNGKWKISRWYIEVDSPLRSSPLPQDTKLSKAIQFIPDNRDICKR